MSKRSSTSTTPRVTQRRRAGADHQVVTVISEQGGAYRREPCGGCPWRIDQTGVFPAEAFRHSARTAYDMATNCFAFDILPALKDGDSYGATQEMSPAQSLRWVPASPRLRERALLAARG